MVADGGGPEAEILSTEKAMVSLVLTGFLIIIERKCRVTRKEERGRKEGSRKE